MMGWQKVQLLEVMKNLVRIHLLHFLFDILRQCKQSRDTSVYTTARRFASFAKSSETDTVILQLIEQTFCRLKFTLSGNGFLYLRQSVIAKLPDLVRVQQLHSSCAFVEVIFEGNAAMPGLDLTAASPQTDVDGFGTGEDFAEGGDWEAAAIFAL